MATSPNHGPFSTRIAGKRVCFAGSVPRYGRDRLISDLKALGAVVVATVDGALDYLVLGKTRFATQRNLAQHLTERGEAAITILDEDELCRLVVPTLDEALRMLRSGRDGVAHYNLLAESYLFDARLPDLSGQDLRGLDLQLWRMPQRTMTDIDLCGANLSGARPLRLKNCRLDKAIVDGASLYDLEECSATDIDFSRASCLPYRLQGFDLQRSVFHNVWWSNCDFTGANLEGASFHGANLTRANFTGLTLKHIDFSEARLAGAKLVDADLRGSKFHRADLTSADLTGARVNEADFTHAELAGAVLDRVDIASAVNLRAVPLPDRAIIGPAVREWLRVAATATRLDTSVKLRDGDREVTLTLDATGGRSSASDSDGGNWSGTGEQIVRGLANRWYRGTPSPLSVTVLWHGTGPTTGQLTDLARPMWCELFGLSAPSRNELRQMAQDQLGCWAAILRNDPDGVARWHREWFAVTRLAPAFFKGSQVRFRGLDLAGAKLAGWRCSGMDIREALFTGADLQRSWCDRANLSGADFTGASLREASMVEAVLRNARCCNADLTGADLHSADLRGADLTGAILRDAKLAGAKFDEHTRFPRGFRPALDMKWKGSGAARAKARQAVKKSSRPLDAEAFMKRVEASMEAGKLLNALAMLKAERFKLYAQVTPECLVGVVRSQSDPNRVYSCRLKRDGSYACCTQNLRSCGGLRGSLCKHLLVLIIGLAKAGEFDLTEVDAWIAASRAQKPVLDKEAMSETLLRYKGAEAGEVDWRPTETIPEDYYAL